MRNLLVLSSVAFTSGHLSANPFVLEEGKVQAQYVYSEGLTRAIVGENGPIKGANSEGYGESYDILTVGHTVIGSYGLGNNQDLSVGGTFKFVDGEKSDFQGVTELMVDYKYRLPSEAPYYYGVSAGIHYPPKEYETSTPDAPGTFSTIIPLGFSAAYYDAEKMPVFFNVEAKYKFRSGDAPEQTDIRLEAYYTHAKFSVGGFYGLLDSYGGIALDPSSAEWQEAREKNDNKNPYHMLNESFRYVGLGAYWNLPNGTVGVSYVDKQLENMKNSDLNNTVSFSVMHSI